MCPSRLGRKRKQNLITAVDTQMLPVGSRSNQISSTFTASSRWTNYSYVL